MRSLFLSSVGAAFILSTAVLSAQEAVGDGRSSGPAVNSTVFYTQDIAAVTSMTEVFGDGQRLTAVAVEYTAEIANDTLSSEQFSVSDRNILRVYANEQAAMSNEGSDGRFVILELDPEDESAVTFAAGVDEPAQAVVAQTGQVATVTGDMIPATETAIINTRQVNLIVDDFRQFRFTDPETGLILNYNLFIPNEYDADQEYPLVLFMHDAGVTGTNPLRTLEQGLGAVSFASPRDQRKHPSFVLAPQYPVSLANDASQTSVYADMTVRLIEALQQEYSVDPNRLYTTGQSGGCMTSIALNIKYPDLFAASLLVAGQWDVSQVAPLAQDRVFAIVSQDDKKAYPGMSAIMDTLEGQGATVTRAVWNGRSTPEEFTQSLEDLRAESRDSNIYFVAFEEGTVIPEGESAEGAAGHVNTWPIAYDIPGVRDWLFEQSK
ncbi:prolyl oligopeptidase family serine peptidase [Paracoccus albus]|uniref:prolyl oligopeptidase family serine peptidase n=1 Tax=Paracoccus albus TaxID=3017784 RepID=UPI0022F039FD|nr:prolyl oligopeptidase family serine peptidase [Paracoccus albus]WBU60699.1 prolyl oligopeptidase family serine peptidase [Paracoccus albus]